MGLQTELKRSLEIHQQGIPVLVSSSLLRGRSMGQIDLLIMKKTQHGWLLEFFEVKNSEVGVEAMVKSQNKRLFEAQSFLGALFGVPVKLTRLIG